MTDAISLSELEVLFDETLARCSPAVLDGDDDSLECDVFEEAEAGVTSFFHETSLERLKM